MTSPILPCDYDLIEDGLMPSYRHMAHIIRKNYDSAQTQEERAHFMMCALELGLHFHVTPDRPEEVAAALGTKDHPLRIMFSEGLKELLKAHSEEGIVSITLSAFLKEENLSAEPPRQKLRLWA